MVRLSLLSAVFLLSSVLNAQPTLLPAGEKVAPVRLLEFRDEPGRFIFVGKSQNQYNVFEIKEGKVNEILMTGGSVMYDGGSLLLDLEGGRHLFVPSDQRYNYVQGRQTSYIVYLDRAREELQKRKLDSARLAQLGLGDLLKIEEVHNTNPREEKTHKPLPRDGQLLFLRLEEKISSSEKDSFKELLNKLTEEGGCLLLDPQERRLYMNTFALVCDSAKAPDMQIKLARIKGLNVQAIASVSDVFSRLPLTGGVNEAMHIVPDTDLPFAVRITALRELLNHRHEWTARKGSLEFAKSVWGAHSVMTQLDLLSEVLGEADLLDAKWAIVQRGNLPWDWKTIQAIDAQARGFQESSENFRRLVSPLRALTVELLSGLKKIGLDETYRLTFLHAGSADGGALPLLLGNEMMPAWLNWWMQNVSVVKDVPMLPSPKELKDGHWSFSRHSGGMFQDIHLSGNLIDAKKWSEPSAYSLFGELESRDLGAADPLIQLGMNGQDKTAKKQIVTFLIQAESVVAENLPKLQENEKFSDFVSQLQAPEGAVPLLRDFWHKNAVEPKDLAQLRFLLPDFEKATDEEVTKILRSSKANAGSHRGHERYTGSEWIMKFIRRLAWPQNIYQRLPSYDEARYFRNVLEILNELLEDSHHVLKNQDTYLSVLDTAVGLQNRLRNAALPESLKNRPSVTRALNDLSRTIQTSLLKPLPYLQMGESSAHACEILLSPNPWAKWREQK